MSAIDDLLAEVRAECPRGLWARGVKLAREGKVSVDERAEHEVVCRVDVPGVRPTVIVYPPEAEWDCDCGSAIDPCAHVAAVVIALTSGATEQSVQPTAATARARIAYRFSTRTRDLALERVVVLPDGEVVGIQRSLAALLREQRMRRMLQPERADLEVDAALGPSPPNILLAPRMPSLLEALSGVDDLELDGRRVRASGDVINPLGVVRDVDNGGVVVSVRAAPEIDKVVGRGVGLCGDVMHPLGAVDICGPWWERLPLRKTYESDGLGEVAASVLPELKKRIEVDVQTDRLPAQIRGLSPRIHIEVEQDGDQLSVLPTLVYGTPAVARIDGDRLVSLGVQAPHRDRDAERKLIHTLRAELNLVPGKRAHYSGAEAASAIEKIRSYHGAGSTAAHVAEELVPRVTAAGDRVDIAFSVPGTQGTVTAQVVLQAWLAGQSLVPVSGGGFAPLPIGWLQEHGQRVADLLAARNEDGSLPVFAVLDAARLLDELDTPHQLDLGGLQAIVDNFETLPVVTLPTDLTATLRSYQQRGVDWLCFLRDAKLGCILADDMGLGKTVQALCALRGRSLVVCPTSVVPNWAAEIEKFRPQMSVCVFHGPKRSLDPEADVVITTYALMRIDIDLLAATTWDVLVLDEAQAIKNPDSQAARAAYRLDAVFRVAMSGTPVENRLDELWSQLHFANPGLLGGRSDFANRYASPIERGDTRTAARLRQRIRPFILRRLKRNVAKELPPRTESVLHVELSEYERTMYDAVRAASRADIVKLLDRGGNVFAALEALLRLRQAACHPALLPGTHADSSSKVAVLLDAIEAAHAGGHKSLVFSQWTSMLDLIEPHLHDAGIDWVRLDGSTRDRAGVVKAFQDPTGPPVLLASLKAGGTGLNLTAADHVFLVDPWWNPAAEDQAADRAHRIGQDKPVMIYRLVTRDTVEERILELQRKKRAVADAVLDGASAAASLSRDDLLALLR